jgi:transposase
MEMVAACLRPGVSVSAIALTNGLNTNLLRRWVKESRERIGTDKPLAINRPHGAMTVVPVTLASAEDRGREEIRIDIRRTGTTVQLSWPTTRTHELSVLLKELLK